MAENNKPTNIERLSDLIDLEVQDGEEVQIEEPMQMVMETFLLSYQKKERRLISFLMQNKR